MWKILKNSLEIPVNKDKYDFKVKKHEMFCLPVFSTGEATSASGSPSGPASTQKSSQHQAT
jgi:hypothetical protein